MQRKVLPIIAGPFLLFSVFILSCNKLNTTDIGSELIPLVDNVSTFETNLLVTTTQGIFNDSTILAATDDHALGSIGKDLLFGKTNANIFLELKPTTFPYYWGNASDTVSGAGLGVDSVVLCLAYKGFYGDTTIPQTLKVYSIANTVTDFKDSAYRLGRYSPTLGNLLGTATIDPTKLRNITYFTNKKDSAQNQIRIRLSDAFRDQLFGRDSSSNGANNAFKNDSIFRSFYKGFAIIADSNSLSANGLFYVNLADEKTRLEVHFRKRNAGVKDTIFNSLRFNTTASSTVAYSARANYIKRNRGGAQFNPPTNFGDPNAIYIQSTPGSYANLKIPGLDTMTNRIIHRAELILEQINDPLDLQRNVLVPPNFLYLDAIDTPYTHWRPIPFDLSSSEGYAFYPSVGGIDFPYFGGYLRHKTDPNFPAVSLGYYNFNLSRYVQHIVTKLANQSKNYELRVYAPFQLNYPEFFFGPSAFSNSLAFGRVKLGSGSNPNYRLRLHIIYSKI